jgi:lipoprotein-anchoring transpeptidase ErfK/SrfK
MKLLKVGSLALALVVLGACNNTPDRAVTAGEDADGDVKVVTIEDGRSAQQQDPELNREQSPSQERTRPGDRQDRDRDRDGEQSRERGPIRLVVDKSDRELRIYRGNEVERTHAVAVGDKEHETPSGSWRVHQVDINPDWTPPDSEWAKDEEPKPPGHPENPMGRVRMIFNAPYSIHGTSDRGSLGRAASHGSIRLGNEAALRLAEELLREGDSWQGDEWFQKMKDNPKEMHRIRLSRPVPIEITD